MQVEIFLFLLTAFKVTALLPNYLIKNINWIYWVFIINSGTTYWLSHVLHQRNCIVWQRNTCYAKVINFLFGLRILALLGIIFIAPALHVMVFGILYNDTKDEYNFLLTCDEPERVYPKRFLMIYCIDCASAIVDMIVFICIPKTAGTKQRLKVSRQADIENTFRQKKLDESLRERENERERLLAARPQSSNLEAYQFNAAAKK